MEKVQKEWIEEYNAQEPTPALSCPAIYREIYRALQNFFEHGSMVLEAGCGDGSVCFFLEKKGINTIGLDFAPNILHKAHSTGKNSCSNVQFIIADVTHLPFRDMSFDGLISLGVIEHFRLREGALQAFAESFRILKKSGKIFLTVPNLFVPLRNRIVAFLSMGKLGTYHTIYTANYLARIARSAGFAHVSKEIVDLWPPVLFMMDGSMRILGISEPQRCKVRRFFEGLPENPFLKAFLGYILVTARPYECRAPKKGTKLESVKSSESLQVVL